MLIAGRVRQLVSCSWFDPSLCRLVTVFLSSTFFSVSPFIPSFPCDSSFPDTSFQIQSSELHHASFQRHLGILTRTFTSKCSCKICFTTPSRPHLYTSHRPTSRPFQLRHPTCLPILSHCATFLPPSPCLRTLARSSSTENGPSSPSSFSHNILPQRMERALAEMSSVPQTSVSSSMSWNGPVCTPSHPSRPVMECCPLQTSSSFADGASQNSCTYFKTSAKSISWTIV